MRLRAHGISVDVPPGWEGKIFRRSGGRPALHVASFALPSDDGEFGSFALRSLHGRGALVAIPEYTPNFADRPLFAHRGLPHPISVRQLSPRALQRRRPGLAGIQRFFTAQGRAFCLYVVVASHDRSAVVAETNRILATVRIDPAPGSSAT